MGASVMSVGWLLRGRDVNTHTPYEVIFYYCCWLSAKRCQHVRVHNEGARGLFPWRPDRFLLPHTRRDTRAISSNPVCDSHLRPPSQYETLESAASLRVDFSVPRDYGHV